MQNRALMILVAGIIASPSIAQAETVFARSKIEHISNPAGVPNPACSPVEQSRNVGDRLKEMGENFVGKAVSAVPGLGGTDPFNTKRTNQSACKDLCVIIPTGAKFTARGSISGTDASAPWEGELPAGLPKALGEVGWANAEGPAVESTQIGDVVCYTFKNWSHTTDRLIGLEVKY